MNTVNHPEKKQADENIPEDLQYPPAEDIYEKIEKVPFSEEEELVSGEAEMIGADMDVPGSELDDKDEVLGEEDEENNYYSLGGDNHENLEENNGD